jgi:hypothetical protein
MKKITTFFTALLLISSSLMQAQTLEDILKEHFAATGQDSILKVQTEKFIGKMVQGGLEIPFIQMAKRPDKVRVQGTFQDLTFIQTYDGSQGWNLNPFAGSTEAQPMSEDELKTMKYQSDIDGMLWDWKDKGYKVTYEGKDDMEGTPCYKIKVETPEGDSFTYYIDADSYILLRTNSRIKVMGNETQGDSYYSNYMQVNGIAVPGKIENKVNDQVAGTIIIDTVRLNIQIPDSLFGKPGKK